MKVIETDLPGVLILEPKVFGDARGFFLESWHHERYAEVGITAEFVQDNLSFSRAGVLRGLHFQNPNAQGKLVQVVQGEVYDVAVDIRTGSPHFGKWVGVTLSSDNKRQLFVPPDFAHGFCVTSDTALFSYRCTDYYNPRAEIAIQWNDPELGIEWPVNQPELSEKDRLAPNLSQLAEDNKLPSYG
ncbi:MAG: dTDP-4-dehydrorhamnose 3,5-epimerase [Gammaproteobacteria bacterium]|nr:dTDP-4-dehydrorhamnose 3,5-epimerase [Gammaproteobacteria bacterium]